MSKALKWICRVIRVSDRSVPRRIDAIEPIVADGPIFPPNRIVDRVGARVAPMAIEAELLQRRARTRSSISLLETCSEASVAAALASATATEAAATDSADGSAAAASTNLPARSSRASERDADLHLADLAIV